MILRSWRGFFSTPVSIPSQQHNHQQLKDLGEGNKSPVCTENSAWFSKMQKKKTFYHQSSSSDQDWSATFRKWFSCSCFSSFSSWSSLCSFSKVFHFSCSNLSLFCCFLVCLCVLWAVGNPLILRCFKWKTQGWCSWWWLYQNLDLHILKCVYNSCWLIRYKWRLVSNKPFDTPGWNTWRGLGAMVLEFMIKMVSLTWFWIHINDYTAQWLMLTW